MHCWLNTNIDINRYQFLNQRIPAVWDDLEQVINDILSKYDIQYLSNDDKRVIDAQRKRESSKTVNEGSRYTEVLREMNARLHDFIKTKPLEEIRQMCIKYNNLYCRPPLESAEFERM